MARERMRPPKAPDDLKRNQSGAVHSFESRQKPHNHPENKGKADAAVKLKRTAQRLQKVCSNVATIVTAADEQAMNLYRY